jgi:hypothetical protein
MAFTSKESLPKANLISRDNQIKESMSQASSMNAFS